MNLQSLKDMSDQEILSGVKRLVASECQATAVVVAHLGEIECRKLYLEQGCGSLFTYCMQVLHFSEHEAYNRIEAARIVRRFPSAWPRLAAGDLHLTALRLLGPLLTPENHDELLAAAKHKSKREVEEMVARLRPQPDARTLVRRVPHGAVPAADAVASRLATASSTANATANVAPVVPGMAAGCDGDTAAHVPPASLAPAHVSPADELQPRRDAGSSPQSARSRPATVVPLAPERYKVQFTASAATCVKLRQAQALLRHRIPAGDVAAVIDQALDLLVRELEKKKFAATDRPRRVGYGPVAERPVAAAGQESSRHIPAAVKRTVWQRDGGRCAFVAANGIRCTERGQLEFDHIHPHADGGPSTVHNLRLLCRSHNRHEANLFFGVWQDLASG